jgi:biotin operon repressor
MEHEDAVYDHAEKMKEPQKMRLQVAAMSLHQSGQAPSAAALALALGISRPALYRAYGVREIREALKLLKNCATAASATRTDRKRKKSGWIANRPPK